jgi:probable phosphoglycerate mutase
MKLFFVRHGESEANVLGVISNRGYKHGLTEKGRRQALDLAARLKGIPIARIYTSPLMRAVQTAEILCEAVKAPIKIAGALREFGCGEIEGKSDEASWAIHRQAMEDWLLRGLWERRIEGGESLNDIRDRFVPFIRRLLQEDPGNGKSLVLVGHGGLYISALPLVLENVSFEIAAGRGFPNTSYVLAETRPQGLVCLEWCGKSVGQEDK